MYNTCGYILLTDNVCCYILQELLSLWRGQRRYDTCLLTLIWKLRIVVYCYAFLVIPRSIIMYIL